MPSTLAANLPLSLWIPVLGMAAFSLVTACLSIWETWQQQRLASWRFVLALLSVLLLLLACVWQWLRGVPFEMGFMSFDRFSMFFALLVLVAALAAVLQIQGSIRESRGDQQLYAAPLLAAMGAIVMVTATDLVAVYLGFALSTVPLIVWVGLSSRPERDHEIRIKYFLTAGLASAFFICGLVFLYTATGTTSLVFLHRVAATDSQQPLFILGLLFVCVGLAFKMAWVPFHFSSPDLYEGGATVAIGFVSLVSKLSALAVLLRILNGWWTLAAIPWFEILSAAAVLALLVGHLAALSQSNLKRRLAYGSVGQVGFFLLGMAAAGTTLQTQEAALTALLYYGVAFTLMTLGAFAVVLAIGRRGEELQQDTEYTGLAKRAPMLAAALALFLASLAGLPPTAGFVGKFYLIQVALDAGCTGLAVLALIGWIVSAYYYLEIVVMMYFKSGPGEKTATVGHALLVVLFGCALLTLYWGLFPNNILIIAAESARSLLY